jgi:hypothetical protein
MSWNSITDQPASLSDISPDEAAKLAGIAKGADVTSAHTALNTTNVGAYTAALVSAYAVDPAARINAHTTTISGGKITTDSITANQIAAGAITANELAANSIIAGKILAGEIVAGKLSIDSVITGNVQANQITKNYWASAASYTVSTTSMIFEASAADAPAGIPVFILASLTQSYISYIELKANRLGSDVLLWVERPIGSTLACRGWSGVFYANTPYVITLSSWTTWPDPTVYETRNNNAASIFAFGMKR